MDGFAREVAMVLKGQTNVAIFGPRDTGKTTFTTQLAAELEGDHGPDAPPHIVVRVNLQRVLSIPSFIGAVHDGLTKHKDRAIRKQAKRAFEVMEKELGFDIKVIKGSVKRTGVTPEQDGEALHAQLASIAELGSHVVVVFDEFQRLRRCPGDPLSLIRSALMSGTANHVSLLFTGSIREALKMMLADSDEPLFNEALQMQLPQISKADFLEFLEFHYEASEKPADEDALDYLVSATDGHPMRTQQLAFFAWNQAGRSKKVTLDDVQAAYEEILSRSQTTTEFESIYSMLADGDEPEVNALRALSLLAERGGSKITSRENVALYGFNSHARIPDAMSRLLRRGLIEEIDGKPTIVDPFLAEWLRRESSLRDATPLDDESED